MRKVEAKIIIQASPAVVLAAFIEPEPLKGWWGVEKKLIELHPGGVYALTWQSPDSGIGFVSTGIVKNYKPADYLAIEKMLYFNPERPILGPMSLLVETKPSGQATEIYVCQDGYQTGPDWDWYYQAVVQAWPQALQTLKAYLEAD